MATAISNVTALVSPPPLSARAETVAVNLSALASAQPLETAADAAADVATFRYNSFEFVYKQDYGKIVLLRQEPQTGNEIAQFPSAYYLQQYAAAARAQRSAEQAQNRTSEPAPATASDDTGDAPVQSTDAVAIPAAANAAAGSAPTPAPAPVPAASPRVDIKA